MRRSRSVPLLLTLAWIAWGSASAQAQGIFVQKDLTGGIHWWAGNIEYYPPRPYPRPVHGPSLYSQYGSQRLEGRVLALPWGFSPPGPQAIDRYTIATIGRPKRSAPAPLPVRPTRYPHTGYIRSYRHTGYAR